MKNNYTLILILSFGILHHAFAKQPLEMHFLSQEIIVNDTTDTEIPDTTMEVSKLDRINAKMEKFIKYSPLPMVSYSSETDWLFGLTKINAFRMGTKDQNDVSIQPSQITGFLYLTLNKQYKGLVTSDLIFGKNKYKSYTQIIFIDFPNYYFGVGDYTELADECLVETENLSIEQSFSYNITKQWYVGIKYLYNNYYKVDLVPNSELYHCNIADLGKNKGLQSGLGIKINRETRDNRFNAKKGSYIYFEYMNFGSWIGSKFDYNSYVLDLRKYITPLKWLTIAGQFYTEAKYGNVPIQSLALMGGDNRMRGIYIGRFRDKTMIEGQVELRFPIYWIFGATVFSGLGEVAPELGKLSLSGTKWTYGAGLRINMNEATRSNIRLDIGFFEGQPLYFFTFLEAF